MDVSLAMLRNHEIMEEEQVGSMSSLSAGGDREDDGDGLEPSDLAESSEDEFLGEETTTTSSSSSSCNSSDHLCLYLPLSTPSTFDDQGPLFEMSSLISVLPLKRGLSRHYEGKSQSFTSLSNVGSLEDLAKAERPYKKLMKSCRSCAGGLDIHKSVLSPTTASSTSRSSATSKVNKNKLMISRASLPNNSLRSSRRPSCRFKKAPVTII